MSTPRTLLLFGPGKYFGFELARLFGSKGFHIVLLARDEERLVDMQRRLNALDIPCDVFGVDVRKSDELHLIISKLALTKPPIHAVIFNIKGDTANETSADQITEHLSVAVGGAYSVIQTVTPVLVQDASILLTGGGLKDNPDASKLALSISKSALHTLYLAIIEPLKRKRIFLKTVVIDGMVRDTGPILPGTVADAFWNAFEQDTTDPVYVR